MHGQPRLEGIFDLQKLFLLKTGKFSLQVPIPLKKPNYSRGKGKTLGVS